MNDKRDFKSIKFDVEVYMREARALYKIMPSFLSILWVFIRIR